MSMDEEAERNLAMGQRITDAMHRALKDAPRVAALYDPLELFGEVGLFFVAGVLTGIDEGRRRV